MGLTNKGGLIRNKGTLRIQMQTWYPKIKETVLVWSLRSDNMIISVFIQCINIWSRFWSWLYWKWWKSVSEPVSKMEHLRIGSLWHGMSQWCEYVAFSRCQGSYQTKQFCGVWGVFVWLFGILGGLVVVFFFFFSENVVIRVFLCSALAALYLSP